VVVEVPPSQFVLSWPLSQLLLRKQRPACRPASSHTPVSRSQKKQAMPAPIELQKPKPALQSLSTLLLSVLRALHVWVEL
jgi:hypothetical protein